MNEIVSKVWTWLKSKPFWMRIIALLALATLVLLSTSACGTQKVTVRIKDTPSGVSISTTQNKADSSGTNIQVNPNINYNPK